MPKYKTLAEPQAAYQGGQVTDTEPLMLDNDCVTVQVPDGDDYSTVFEMHPDDLLEQAVDLLGIPHDHA